MLVELYIFSLVMVAYGTFTTLALIGISKLRRHAAPDPRLPPSFISIIISARNEEKNIALCLQEIIKQTYPADYFELILIDDASEDETIDKARVVLENSPFSYKLICQKEHIGKKACVAAGIEVAKGSVIVTSDADVVFRYSTWLSGISNYFNCFQPQMLVMPVDFVPDPKLLTAFQIVENAALTAITAGYTGLQHPFMCNGANLAFKKSAYESVNGYQSHAHISSGEDVFLLEAIKKINRRGIHYMWSRELTVRTVPQSGLSALLSQRLRWASKSKHNSSALNLFSGLVVMLANLLFIALFVAILKKSFIMPLLSIFIGAKFIFDFLLLFLASDFLGRTKYLLWFLPFECLYWIYALVVGLTSFFWKPTWKGKKTV